MGENQVTVKGGRKRKNLVKFYLNDRNTRSYAKTLQPSGVTRASISASSFNGSLPLNRPRWR